MKNNNSFLNIEELERILKIQNEHTQKEPKNKEQKAYLQGIKTGLEILTDYKYSFSILLNKIIEI